MSKGNRGIAPRRADQPARQDPGIAAQQVTLSQQEWHVGPIPSPKNLKAYDEFMPGLAARIIATAEAEGIHRRQVENEELKDARFALTETFNVKKRGQWFGFAIAMSGIAGAIGLGFAGHTVACVGVCGAALAGLVSAFVGDKRSP